MALDGPRNPNGKRPSKVPHKVFNKKHLKNDRTATKCDTPVRSSDKTADKTPNDKGQSKPYGKVSKRKQLMKARGLSPVTTRSKTPDEAPNSEGPSKKHNIEDIEWEGFQDDEDQCSSPKKHCSDSYQRVDDSYMWEPQPLIEARPPSSPFTFHVQMAPQPEDSTTTSDDQEDCHGNDKPTSIVDIAQSQAMAEPEDTLFEQQDSPASNDTTLLAVQCPDSMGENTQNQDESESEDDMSEPVDVPSQQQDYPVSRGPFSSGGRETLDEILESGLAAVNYLDDGLPYVSPRLPNTPPLNFSLGELESHWQYALQWAEYFANITLDPILCDTRHAWHCRLYQVHYRDPPLSLRRPMPLMRCTLVNDKDSEHAVFSCIAKQRWLEEKVRLIVEDPPQQVQPWPLEEFELDYYPRSAIMLMTMAYRKPSASVQYMWQFRGVPQEEEKKKSPEKARGGCKDNDHDFTEDQDPPNEGLLITQAQCNSEPECSELMASNSNTGIVHSPYSDRTNFRPIIPLFLPLGMVLKLTPSEPRHKSHYYDLVGFKFPKSIGDYKFTTAEQLLADGALKDGWSPEHYAALTDTITIPEWAYTRPKAQSSSPWSRRVRRNLLSSDQSLQTMVGYMRREITVMHRLDTGEVHPDFPTTWGHMALLTEDKLDSLAEFYHQVGQNNQYWVKYPSPMLWRTNDNVWVKRRKMMEFIGIRSGELPPVQVIEWIQQLNDEILRREEAQRDQEERMYELSLKRYLCGGGRI